MGDRANVAIKTGPEKLDHVWLYTHWAGYELPSAVQAALRSENAKARYGDSSYLCRILIDQIMKDHDSETGYGISHMLQDNSYPVIEVDTIDKVVRVRAFDHEAWVVNWEAPAIWQGSFEEYTSLDDPSWEFFESHAAQTK